MTSELEVLKTNEFLRRRKLRLQQVREQSKDIAKKIRQRANVEKLKQATDLNVKKQKEYFEKQGALVKKLEHLYSKGAPAVGTGHKNAVDTRHEVPSEKVDLSKLRGREAAAELKRRKQEKLDEQKKLLDRKLLAREAANELSREKSNTVANKLSKKNSENNLAKATDNPEETSKKDNGNVDNNNDKPLTNDMATQWDLCLPNEWEPNIPTLSLPKDDIESLKETENNVESKSDGSKRLDLFALSEEMPLSLRGGLTNIEERVPVKPSLTLVSEYLQSRAMRLRETDTTKVSTKKQTDDLQSIKQTILRTRSSKPEGNSVNACHVLDEQIIPVPSWQPEKCYEYCSHSVVHNSKQMQLNVTNLNVKNFRSTIPSQQGVVTSPVLRRTSPFRRNKFQCDFSAKNTKEISTKSTTLDNDLARKSSVMLYNHFTRDTRDIPAGKEGLVIRSDKNDEDAYSQAMKETNENNTENAVHKKKIQDMRNKVAMTKQNIEKEYKNTINFLNSLPKDKPNRPIRNAYMNEHREKLQKESHQHKLQQKYKQIEKECKKHSCTKNRIRSKSPVKEIDDDFQSNDFQYSWMPVPESDSNLAIHTIPTTLKQGKVNNTVKFSKVDSYHEYRSRHKHTPPTKDTAVREKQGDRKIETVIIENNSSNSTEYSSVASEESFTENESLKKKTTKPPFNELSDAERIIIYKILDSKKNRRNHKKTQQLNNVTKSPASIKVTRTANDDQPVNDKKSNEEENRVLFEEPSEGVYKTINEKGDNIMSMLFSNKQHSCKKVILAPNEIQDNSFCCCNKIKRKGQQQEQGTNVRWETGEPTARTPNTCIGCKCNCAGPSNGKDNNKPSEIQPSTADSISSFKAAAYDTPSNAVPDCGFVKLLDDGGQEAGKLYVGASGFLKHDAYEVVIQLRKKDESNKTDDKENVDNPDVFEKYKRTEIVQPASSETSQGYKKASIKYTDENKEKLHSPRNVPNEVPKTSITANPEIIVPQELCSNSQAPLEQNSTNYTDKVESIEKTVDPHKNSSDKGVHTSFQDSYTIPRNVPKTNPLQNLATSTYTQTSANSPNPLPQYFRMSSSTSTAYMSPPEYVLPKFLRRDYRTVGDESYDSMKNVIVQDEIENSDHQNSTEECERCNCKRCINTRKITSSKTKVPLCCKKHSKHKFSAPPNTARTCSTENSYDIYYYKRERTNNQCHKKVKEPVSLPSSKTQTQNNKHQIKRTKKPSQLYKKKNDNTSNCKNSYKNSNNNTHFYKPNLKPIIQDYVNKLLSLNRDGVKVVEVADQDCSSITTPGSSIINVPKNIDTTKPIQSNISLEKIKSMLKLQILDEYIKKKQDTLKYSVPCSKNQLRKNTKLPSSSRKKQVHKVKSLNISRNILKTKNLSSDSKQFLSNITSSLSSTNERGNPPEIIIGSKKYRSRSSPTPRQTDFKLKSVDMPKSHNTTREQNNEKFNIDKSKIINDRQKSNVPPNRNTYLYHNHRASLTSTTLTSTDSDNGFILKMQNGGTEIPVTMSTQTNEKVDKEINYMKLAEDKLHNIEKIADLTEKCTKRLSNLARVLDEVRKNKSLAYSHISTSDTASDSDQKSDKNICHIKSPSQPIDIVDTQTIPEQNTPESVTTIEKDKVIHTPDSTDFIPFLTNIPKPNNFKTNVSNLELTEVNSIACTKNVPVVNKDGQSVGKIRSKPPPALSRIHLKNDQEHVIPHELSTVLEVDSPMSNKFRTPSSRGTKDDETDSTSSSVKAAKISDENGRYITEEKEHCNPDLLQTNTYTQQLEKLTTESSDDFKLQMMDLNQFNDIMLKPFITFKEHAKRCNIVIDEGSNLEDNNRGTDDVSSLHSDGSLPDVIAELLKRNIISEPFKFDTASNVNSTTVSSESTLSVLALSKVRKDKRNSGLTNSNKENIEETSDSLSFSSNPDLENAFKKLGMGWASSTLKKTKERLALSSSSNTSSTSLSQSKLKSSNNQDIPALVTDSISAILSISKKPGKGKNINLNKNAEQQTSLTNSMTVKEFLTNELASKITFTNKSHRNKTGDEFVSLFETKMPENMKDNSQVIREECSGESTYSANNNRARTSTPVQIFKSTTYHSSSSSNLSNGLFSNADDLSSVKVTSNSIRNHSTSDKDDLTVPNFSLRLKKSISDCSKSE